MRLLALSSFKINSIFLLSAPHVLFLLRSLFTSFFVFLNDVKQFSIIVVAFSNWSIMTTVLRHHIPTAIFLRNVLNISEETILFSLKPGCNIFVAPLTIIILI